MWATFDLPSGVTALSLHEPIIWDGERLPLRRAPLWMEHTYDVLVDELGLDPGRFAELIESEVGGPAGQRSCGSRRRAIQRRRCCSWIWMPLISTPLEMDD